MNAYQTTAATLRANLYAPAAIQPGHSIPGGAWAANHYNYDESPSDYVAAVLTAVAPPRGPGGMDDFRSRHLVTLTADVRQDLRADLDAIVSRHVGAARCPVRVAPDGAERVYLFAAALNLGFTEQHAAFEFSTVKLKYLPLSVAVEVNAAGEPYTWPVGSPLDVARTELAELDADKCAMLMSDIRHLFDSRRPPEVIKPGAAPAPLREEGKPLTFDNRRALKKLRENGWSTCPIAPDGTIPRRTQDYRGEPWGYSAFEGHSVGLVNACALKVSLSTAETDPALFSAARAGVEKFVEGGKVLVRRGAEGKSLVFVFKGQLGDLRDYADQKFPGRMDGGLPTRRIVPEPYKIAASLTLTSLEKGVVRLDGDWETHPLDAKVEELAPVDRVTFQHLASALQKAVNNHVHGTPAVAAPPKRSRKAG